MPKKSPRLLEDFLVPHLNLKTFGSRLQWLNKEEKIFSIIYRHKNKANWTQEDAEVFVCWDKMKDPKRCSNMSANCYFTISRGRMNSAMCKLAKMGNLKQVKSQKWSKDNGTKYMHYQIIQGISSCSLETENPFCGRWFEQEISNTIYEKTFCPEDPEVASSPAPSESSMECESNTTDCNEISKLEYILSGATIDLDDAAFLDVQDTTGKPDLQTVEPTRLKDIFSDDEETNFDREYSFLCPEMEEISSCSVEIENLFSGRWFEQEISNAIYDGEPWENLAANSEFSRCTTSEESFSDPEPYLDDQSSQKHKEKVGFTGPDKVPRRSAKCTRRSAKCTRCNVCDVTRSRPIPSSLRMKSRKHKQKLAKKKRVEKLSHPSIYDTPQVKQATLSASPLDVVFKCALCDICFCGLRRLKYHLKSKKHQRKVDVASWQKTLGQSNSPSQEYDSVVPEVYILPPCDA